MSEQYSFPVSGSNPCQASSPAQPANSSSPLANASNASFSPSPVTSGHTVPMSAPAGQAVHRGHWVPVIPGAQRTPHQGTTIPAQQDSQLVAQLAKQRAKAGGDQDDDVTEPTKKASLFSRATHKIAKRAGLTTSSLKQPSQIQPQSQHEEPAQSGDNEVDDFVFVSGHASLEPQAASYSPAQQPSYLSYPPQSFYAAPAAYPSYSPASYPEPTVVAYGDFSPAQASRSRESRLPLMASRLHYTSAGSTSYGYTTTVDSDEMSRCLAQRVDYRLVDAKQELQVAAQELVNAVDNKVFVDTLAEARDKRDVNLERAIILTGLQTTQCRLEVLCNVEHGNSFGRVWVYDERSGGVQWSRAHEFIGNESQYAQSHFGQGYNEFAKNKARIEGLFGGFKAEYDRYQQAWAVVKQLEAESHS